MAKIPSPSPSSISASLSYNRFTQFPSTTTIPFRSTVNRLSSFPRFTISPYSDSSKRVANPSSITDPYPDFEIHHETPVSRWHKGSLVYVTLPIDTVNFSGKIKRLKTMMYSFKALALSGVEGVVMEVWWGLVERDVPMTYDWKGYLEIVALARHFGLKVRAVMAFHELSVVGDPHWKLMGLNDSEEDIESEKDDDSINSESIPTNDIGDSSTVCENTVVNKLEDPFEGMIFESLNAAKVYYSKYGNENGFPTRFNSTQKRKWNDSGTSYVRFSCGRQGSHKKKKITKPP